jgi:hypothetical protein
MNVRILLRFLAVIAGAFLLYGVYLLLFPWQNWKIGESAVRRNNITGVVEVQDNGKWIRPQDDPYAAAIPPEKFPYIVLSHSTWGPEGLLVTHLTNRTDQLIEGRLALHLILWDMKLQRRLNIGGDRTLRLNVTLPPKTPIPIALDTNLQSPDPRTVRTILAIQPTAYSGQ